MRNKASSSGRVSAGGGSGMAGPAPLSASRLRRVGVKGTEMRGRGPEEVEGAPGVGGGPHLEKARFRRTPQHTLETAASSLDTRPG